MAQVPAPLYKVEYNGRNITNDISAHLITLVYRDRETAGADEVQIELQDTDGRWKNTWYPEKGAQLKVWIGKNRLTYCGQFTLDEPEFNFAPDTLIIKAISSSITQKLQTKRSQAHENKTLKQIVQTVADLHGFRVSGEIDNIQISRHTQYRKTDLQFLNGLAKKYGYLFSVKGSVISFTKPQPLDSKSPVFSLTRSQLLGGSLKDKSTGTYNAGAVAYTNPVTGELVQSQTIKNADGIAFPQVPSGNTLQVHTKAENQQQADAISKANLYMANRSAISGTLSIPGNELAVAGINFQLSGLYKLSGIYHITESTHHIDRNGGYVTDLVVNKVNNTTTGNAPAKTQAFSAGGGATNITTDLEKNLA